MSEFEEESMKVIREAKGKRIDGLVTIEEDYFDFRGQCYYAWRVEGAKDWNFKPTGHTDRPYVRWTTLNPVEYADRVRRYGLPQRLSKTDSQAEGSQNAMPKGNDMPRTVLVAPNKRIQKQWRKDYPGIQVILGKDYVGYPLPEGYTEVSDLVATDFIVNTSVANPPSDPKRKANT